jgi:hypothetical protein
MRKIMDISDGTAVFKKKLWQPAQPERSPNPNQATKNNPNCKRLEVVVYSNQSTTTNRQKTKFVIKEWRASKKLYGRERGGKGNLIWMHVTRYELLMCCWKSTP